MREADRPRTVTPGRAVIVRNPRARNAPTPAALRAAARPLAHAGWAVDFIESAGPGDATALARTAAADGVDVVVACGGDGTVSEVVAGLAGSDSALAVVPCGTANVWAREAFLPHDAQRALALVANGRRVRIDLGEATIGAAGPRPYLLMCGAGIDAAVVRAVEARPRLKRALGRMAFIGAGAPLVASLRPVRSAIEHDGGVVERALLLAVAGNTRLYGGMVRLADAARIDDGLLDLVTFFDPDPGGRMTAARYAALVARAARGRLSAHTVGGVDYARTRAATITPERPLAVQVDGESIGSAGPDAPLRLRAIPAALEVVIGHRPMPLLGEV